ncbi:MAG: sigma-70 family RNA polymerase sigma factor [Muribaculaceae bacterium]|nr:sigma-70 family RNA polymerase sigma factor [Muribaculaceae bacterium]
MEQNHFTRLFAEMHTRLRLSVRGWLGNDDDAADVVQETFYRLWNRCDSMDSDGEASAILHTTARNLSIDALRRRSSRAMTPITDDVEVADIHDHATTDEDILAKVTAIIDSKLSERDRAILYRRERDGWDFEDLAEEYGLSEANVRMILSRGRRTVREFYRKLYPEL